MLEIKKAWKLSLFQSLVEIYSTVSRLMLILFLGKWRTGKMMSTRKNELAGKVREKISIHKLFNFHGFFLCLSNLNSGKTVEEKIFVKYVTSAPSNNGQYCNDILVP